MMIKLNMTTKENIKILEKEFHLENNIVALVFDLGEYDLEGKTVTAVFEPAMVETVALEIENGLVKLPIHANLISYGMNYIQLNIRWDGDKLEQSGRIVWKIDKSVETTTPADEDVDIISYLLAQVEYAVQEADRVVNDAGDVRIALDKSVEDANDINNTLIDEETGTIKKAEDTKEALDGSIQSANTINDTLADPVTGTIKAAIDKKGELDGSIGSANSINNTLSDPITGTIKQAADKKIELDGSIQDANTINNTLSDVTNGTIKQANDIYDALADETTGAIKQANDINDTLSDETTGTIKQATDIYDALVDETTGAIKQANDINDTLSDETTGTIKQAYDAEDALLSAIDNAQIGDLQQLKTDEKGSLVGSINEIHTDTMHRFETLYEAAKIKSYGVIFEGSISKGTRVEDAVGMIAQVAVDDEIVINDFDDVSFFNRPICCGHHDESGKFHVHAYRDEPGFEWDGSNGEVCYEETPFYYKGDLNNYVSVSAIPIEGYILSPRFKNGIDKEYSPVFPSSTVVNKPTSRSGVFPTYDSLNNHITTAKKYHKNAHTETIAARISDYILQLVEFATKDVQTIMMGAVSMPYSNSHIAKISENNTNRIVIEKEYANLFTIGQTISIGTSSSNDSVAKNRIISNIIDIDGNDCEIHFDGQPVNISIGHFVASRPWINGTTNIIKASSGSPVSNSNGKYPCIWRGKVDPWGSAYSGLSDLMVKRTGGGTAENPYIATLYYLPDPTKYTGALTEDYIELNYKVPTINGYAKTLGLDNRFPHVRITTELGGSNVTYMAAYYYAPDGTNVVYVGGNLNNGRNASPVYFNCNCSPSDSDWRRLSRLFVSRD